MENGLLNENFIAASNIVDEWDVRFLVGKINHFSNEESHLQMQRMLQDYFKTKDNSLSADDIEHDINSISKIFPDVPVDTIRSMAEEIGNEPNRTRIIARRLLKNNQKRSLFVEPYEFDNKLKKLKVSTTDTDVPNKQRCSIFNMDYLNSQPSTSHDIPLLNFDDTTEVLSRLENESEPTNSQSEINKEACNLDTPTEVSDSQSTIIYPSEEYNYVLQLPEQLEFQNSWNLEVKCDNDSNKGNNQIPSITNNQIFSVKNDQISSAANDQIPPVRNDQILNLNENINSTVQQVNMAVGVTEYNLNVRSHVSQNGHIKVVIKKHLPETVTSSSVTIDVDNNYSQTSSSFNKNGAVPGTSKAIQKGNVKLDKPSTSRSTTDEMYNVYDNLQEAFPKLPRKRIKKICKMYHKDKYTKPTHSVWDNIISNLTQNSIHDITISSDDEDVKFFENKPPSPIASASTSEQPIIIHDFSSPDLKDMAKVLNSLLAKKNNSKEDNIESTTMEEESTTVDDTLIYRLLEIFPEACPKYVRRICAGKANTPNVIDELISKILDEGDYPKREKADSPEHKMSSEEQLEIMKQILPDADPNYLQIHCDRLIDKPAELRAFVDELTTTRKYPTMKDYLRKQQISAQQKQYTTEFSLQKFLDVIPDPVAHFSDSKKREVRMSFENHHYALCFLRNQFPKVQIRVIRDLFKKNSTNMLKTCEALEAVDQKTFLKVRRGSCRMPEPVQDIPLLQEIAYIEHRPKILLYLKEREMLENQEREHAKQNGLVETCNCCYDDEVMSKDIYKCEIGCKFCKSCVRKSVEVAFGDGKLNYSCLNDCSSQFNLQVLQAVLPPKMFSIIAVRKQVEEVKAAGIEDLETCPFCDFATILLKDDKLFKCLNPECMKESCRQCKEPSHVPLRCEEVERESDVKLRTYIENKMTEALLRKCYKCGLKFIKADGCNKMTCSCGAMMCYICGQPVNDYKHFNGPGGDRTQLCPLYSDTNQLHEQAVLKGAEAAKEEIGVADDPTKLKFDPTSDIKKHYKEVSSRNPVPGHLLVPNVNPFLNADPGFIREQQIALEQANNWRFIELRHLMVENVNRLRDVDEEVDPPQRHRRFRRGHRNYNHHHHHHHNYDDDY